MDAQLTPVIEEADANRAFYEEFCRSLTPPQLAAMVPDSPWRVKDYIAHLASIDIYVGEWFAHTADGRRWRPNSEDGSPFNIDTWNGARIKERYRAWEDSGADSLSVRSRQPEAIEVMAQAARLN